MHSLEPTYRDKPMFFAGIRMGKNYVSFHLMPVYCCPELNRMSPALKKRMQGKASFNFREVDEACFKDLGALGKSGYRLFRERKEVEISSAWEAPTRVWRGSGQVMAREKHKGGELYVSPNPREIPAPPMYGLTSEQVKAASEG